MYPLLVRIIALLFLLAGFLQSPAIAADENLRADFSLVDSHATAETRTLLLNLHRAIHAQKILFGHQSTTHFGVGWRMAAQRSDVQTACDKLPAVYGWDFNQLGVLKNVTGEDLISCLIRDAYDRGGINTITWHLWNPITGKNFYDTTPAVAAILPGGEKHLEYKKNLDRFASLISNLRGSDGTRIPLIFRPFHEHNKKWFWWGKGNCTEQQFVTLWRFTVTYLRDEKGLHNLIYAYSPDALPTPSKEEYLWGYPGDEFVDVLGYDHYCQNVAEALPGLGVVVQLAQERGKLAAFTETGIPNGLANAKPGNYFTDRLLKPLKQDGLARQIAYILLWHNQSEERYWVPYGEHPLKPDFKAFAADPALAFEADLKNLFSESNK